jgi:hypothetical protein
VQKLRSSVIPFSLFARRVVLKALMVFNFKQHKEVEHPNQLVKTFSDFETFVEKVYGEDFLSAKPPSTTQMVPAGDRYAVFMAGLPDIKSFRLVFQGLFRLLTSSAWMATFDTMQGNSSSSALSAEEAWRNEAFRQNFGLPEIEEAYSSETGAECAAKEAEALAAAAAAQDAAKETALKESEAKAAADAPVEEHIEELNQEDRADLPPSSARVEQQFKNCALPRVVKDVLGNLPEEAFFQAVAMGEGRVRDLDLRILPAGADLLALELKKCAARAREGGRTLYDYDVAAQNGKMPVDRRKAAAVDATHYRNCLEGVFGGPVDRPAEHRISYYNFGQQDLICTNDGRSQKNADAVCKVLRAVVKHAGVTDLKFPRQPSSLRLFFHNREYSDGFLGRRLRCQSGDVLASHPDPSSSMVLCYSKGMTMQTVPRRFLDCPGTNRTRGLGGLPGKTSGEHAWKITQEVFAGEAAATAIDDGTDLLDTAFGNSADDDFVAEDGGGGAGDSDEDVLEDSPKSYTPWPLGTSELLHREKLNMWSVDKIVDFTPQNGALAMAAMRNPRAIIYTGFFTNQAHLDWTKDRLIAIATWQDSLLVFYGP